MHTVRAHALLASFLALAGLTCGDSGTGPGSAQEITELPRRLSVAEEEVVRASNRFAFHLAARVASGGEGFFVSPLSASMALGMTMNGAAGETRDQMRRTLGFGELSQDEINASYRGLAELLVGLDPSVETGIGNAVWIREGFPVRASFRSTVEEAFGARVEALDFGAPSAVETMNAWVRDATGGRIDGIVEPPIDPLTTVLLMNAVHFRGAWTTEFDPEDTGPAPFHLPDGTTTEVEMMEARELEALHDRTPEYAAVELPYGGRAFAMTVVVPSLDVGLEAFVRGLDAEGWRALVDGLREGEVAVYLPRFGMEYERTLNDDLKALGMTDAFEPSAADFTPMVEGARRMQVHVEKVKQKAFVEVDEEGTEAAAATSVEVGVTSAPPTVRADRPFLFVIRERLTGAILFVGAMVDPRG